MKRVLKSYRTKTAYVFQKIFVLKDDNRKRTRRLKFEQIFEYTEPNLQVTKKTHRISKFPPLSSL